MSGSIAMVLTGKLCKDPEMRFLPDGVAVTNFTIFVNNGRDAKDTPWKVTAWRKSAEWCAEWLHKDSIVAVTGTLTVDKATGEPRTWEGRDGVTHIELNLNASDVKPIDNFGKGESSPAAKPVAKPTPTKVNVDYDAADEIPF